MKEENKILNLLDKITSPIVRSVFIFGLLIAVFGQPRIKGQTAGINGPNSISDTLIKVMPLGDSITLGHASGVEDSTKKISYRKDLWDSLNAAGYSVDFVGSLINGDFYSGFDADHEGHSGKTDSWIATNIYNNGGENFLSQNPPDVILLHIGTNGLSTDPSDVENILDEIIDYKSDTGNSVIVIVARIIDWVPNDPNVYKFNNNVESMVKARGDYGDELFMVDMEWGAGIIYAYQPTGDMWNYLHPYETGYSKMAICWKEKLDLIYGAGSPNSAPDVTNPGPQSNSEGEYVSIPITADDVNGDALVYSAQNLPSDLGIDSSSGEISGTISDSASTGSPYYVQISVSDGNPCGNTRIIFSWNVSQENQPPEIQNVPDQDNTEGDSIDPPLQIEASDPDGDSLTYSASFLPTGLSIDEVSGAISGTISYTAANGGPYTYTVQVTVEDNGNPTLSDTVSFSWTITDENGPPSMTLPGTQINVEGDSIDPPLQIEADDPDGDELTYGATGLPSDLNIDPTTGEISGTISYTASSGSPYVVHITVSDDGDPSKSVDGDFTWYVSDANGPPEVNNPGSQSSYQGEFIMLQIEASDPDGDPLIFIAKDLPPDLLIDPAIGLITGKLSPWSINESPYLVKVTVSDGSPIGSKDISFSWIVEQHEVFLPVIIH